MDHGREQETDQTRDRGEIRKHIGGQVCKGGRDIGDEGQKKARDEGGEDRREQGKEGGIN